MQCTLYGTDDQMETETLGVIRLSADRQRMEAFPQAGHAAEVQQIASEPIEGKRGRHYDPVEDPERLAAQSAPDVLRQRAVGGDRV